MRYAVCIVACCPIRKEASHKTEMTSQLLFGETAEMITASNGFIKVRCLHDDYEGWVQDSQMTETDAAFILEYPKTYSEQHKQIAMIDGTPLYLSIGTPIYNDCFFGKYKIEFLSNDSTSFHTRVFTEKAVKEITMKYLNTSYLWGGRSSFGLDCSGFTQLVFRMFQKRLLRDAYQQATQGEAISFLQQAKCGDLAFFDNAEGFITHVGILLNGEEIIHASGRVRIDKIDTQGIVNTDTGDRTHFLRIIKRI
jgi:gamma-D-glutamyl-L-lysine dipeptidyl-peptidase